MGYLRREVLEDMDSADLIALASSLKINLPEGAKRSEMQRIILTNSPRFNPFMKREEAIAILTDSGYWGDGEADEFVDTIIRNATREIL